MLRCGLLGRKLGHSYSPQIHHELASYEYKLYEKEPEELNRFLKSGTFDGLNVTIPYKKAVMPLLDEISPEAAAIGSVNTIVNRAGKLTGYNTDAFGFTWLLQKSGVDVAGKKALVFGSGGASVTVCHVLKSLGADPVVVISRSGENNYENLDRHTDAKILVNATPLGMYPENGTSPVDLACFDAPEGVLDVVYNPARTALMLQAEALSVPHASGLSMLVAQAKKACEYFTDTEIPDTEIDRIERLLSHQMQNIILIGMPGCGKSSIGQALADSLHRPFIDADAEIVRRAGCSIPEIFAKDGEPGFRKIESAVLADLGKASGTILATGGGCVTRPENYPSLHQNGRIVWLTRPLELLPTDGRPMSQANPLEALWETRKALYKKFSDVQISNDHTIAACAAAIEEALL